MARRPAAKPAHAERAHADISPSGAERWWNCPGSVGLIASLDLPRETNIHSETGTAAHELLEMSLSAGRAPMTFTGQVVNKGSKDTVGQVIKVDRSMAVCVEEAIDYIQSYRRPGDKLLSEHELMIPATGQPGHVDVAVYCDKIIDVFDYKHGTNPVEARGNKQGILYALGVWEHIRKTDVQKLKTIRKIRIHIIQPRSRNVDTVGPTQVFELSVLDLYKFAGQAEERAAMARMPNAPRCPGEVQCYYCPAKARCPDLAKAAINAVRMDFDDVVTKPTPDKVPLDSRTSGLEPAELANALSAFPLIELWMEAVRQLGTELAGKGKLPGWKVVEGRSNRRWADEEKVIKALKKLGLGEDDFMPRKLLGLGAIEEILRKPDREPFFKKHCVKPRGNPSLAPESDPRPPYDKVGAAKKDFDEDITK